MQPDLPRNRNGPSRQRIRAKQAAARQERAVEANGDKSELENWLETAVKSVNAEEAMAAIQESKVVTSKSIDEEVQTDNENESAEPVIINDLMTFLGKSEEERLIEREERNKH